MSARRKRGLCEAKSVDTRKGGYEEVIATCVDKMSRKECDDHDGTQRKSSSR